MNIERLKAEMKDVFAIEGEFSEKLFNKTLKALDQQQNELSVARDLIGEYSKRSKINHLAQLQLQAENENLKMKVRVLQEIVE
jgi:hypothetical protein